MTKCLERPTVTPKCPL